MNILVTGAGGFVGRNLTEALRAIADGRDRTRPALSLGEIYTYDIATDPALLDEYCRRADFVIHLAGVNRPEDPAEFMAGNFGFTSRLLEALRAAKNPCPILVSSSVQATLVGRYDNDYGRSKKAGEDLLFAYGEATGAEVLVYRFPNLFGKWCRPNYNSAVATFCHNIAHDLPITVSDPAAVLTLLYIDDLVDEVLDALEGHPHRCEFDGTNVVLTEGGRYCTAPVTHRAPLGEIVSLLESFRDQPRTLLLPEIPCGSLAKKLYSTYLSDLPPEKVAFPLRASTDERGSFTELLRTVGGGQFSVNVAKPGVTKGQHWHNTKWEFFIVVSGEALIEERCLGSDEVLSFRVSGDAPTAVHMLPGYTHSIKNLSDTHDLVTLMWANECFDPQKPDTFFEVV